MPFTLAHSAAALPFRRFRLVPSALVIGTFAPDFEYFLHFSRTGRFGHTLLGSFVLTLPVALCVLWIFHAFVKVPVVLLLPQGIQRRLDNHLYEFRFRGVKRFRLIVSSILLGIGTHVLWDSFTHSHTWLYAHWSILRQPLLLPIVGQIPCYKLLQHASSIIGIVMLTAWFVHWYQHTEPSALIPGKSPSPARKVAILAGVMTIALAGALAWAFTIVGAPTSPPTFKKFVGQAIVTAIALAWWQFVAYGFFAPRAQQRAESRQL